MTTRNIALQRDTDPESRELSPRAAEILRKMRMVAYVLDCHRQAVAKHSQHLAELQAELERLEQRP